MVATRRKRVVSEPAATHGVVAIDLAGIDQPDIDHHRRRIAPERWPSTGTASSQGIGGRREEIGVPARTLTEGERVDAGWPILDQGEARLFGMRSTLGDGSRFGFGEVSVGAGWGAVSSVAYRGSPPPAWKRVRAAVERSL